MSKNKVEPNDEKMRRNELKKKLFAKWIVEHEARIVELKKEIANIS